MGAGGTRGRERADALCAVLNHEIHEKKKMSIMERTESVRGITRRGRARHLAIRAGVMVSAAWLSGDRGTEC